MYLQDRRILEGLRGFLAQMRWPYPFELVARVCNHQEAANLAFYNPNARSITICYQFVNLLFNIAPKPDRPESVEIGAGVIRDIDHDEFIAGALIPVVLHEFGHAVFHMMNVPVFGREEDAADQFALLILAAQDRKARHDFTRQAIRSNAYFWYKLSKQSGGPNQLYRYFDTHSSEIQRFYNTACLAYGADPEGFEEFAKFVENRNCKAEYEQVKEAGLKTITPYMAGN